MEKDMEKQLEEKVEVNLAEAKEAKTHMEERMEGAKEQTREGTKELEKVDSMEHITCAVSRGTARGSVLKRYRKEKERRAKEKVSKDRDTFGVFSDTAQQLAGRQQMKRKQGRSIFDGVGRRRGGEGRGA